MASDGNDPVFDFVMPEDLKELREAFNAALKDHKESLAWARITLSRSEFHADFYEGRGSS